MSVRLLTAASVLALATAVAEGQDGKEVPLVTFVKSKVKDPGKPFAITLEFKVKEGKGKEWEAAFGPFLEASRKEPGCMVFQMVQDADNPDTYFVYEQYKSVAALEEHVKQDYAKTLLKTIRPLQDGMPKPKVFLLPEAK